MKMYLDAFNLLRKSIMSNDFLILVFALITVGVWLITLAMASAVKKRTKEWKAERNTPFTRFLFNWVSKSYTVFTTMITIFPLLGMLGTVCGLLGLDLANGDMSDIKNNFFIALTSTAWGIIFSVIFKILNAFVSDGIEEQIDTARELSKKLD